MTKTGEKKETKVVATAPVPQVLKEKHTLHIELTDEQKNDERVKVFELLGLREEVLASQKEARTHFAAELGAIDKRLTEKRKKVASGYDGLVDCERTLDFVKGRVRVVRMDTGKVIEDREMAPHEKQLPLSVATPNRPTERKLTKKQKEDLAKADAELKGIAVAAQEPKEATDGTASKG